MVDIDENLIEISELSIVDIDIDNIADAEEDLAMPALSDSDAIDAVAGDEDVDDSVLSEI